MSELLVVNPIRRRRKGKRRRKMSAKQAMYFGGGRRRKRRRSRRVAALSASPAPRRRSRRRRSRRVTHLRRNPIRLGGFSVNSFVNGQLMPAGVGAVGALGLDIALGYINPMLPVSLQSGIARTAVRIAGCVGIGWLAGSVMGKRFGEQAAAGALVVTLYDLFKGFVPSILPGVALSEYDMGWYSPAALVDDYDDDDGMNAYTGIGAYMGTGAYTESGEYAY